MKKLSIDLSKIYIWNAVRGLDKQELLQKKRITISLDGNSYQIELTATATNFGGRRLWFQCPECKKRVGCLYLVLGSLPQCRNCANITYPGSTKRRNPLLQRVLKIKRIELKLHQKWLRKEKREKLEVERKSLVDNILQSKYYRHERR